MLTACGDPAAGLGRFVSEQGVRKGQGIQAGVVVSGRSGARSLELVDSAGRPGSGQFMRPSSTNSARAGRLKVLSAILAHLQQTAPDQHQAELPLGARAPPQQARLI